MKQYNKYKDSGVKWIGDIPSHWGLRRTRYLCNICTGDKDTIMRDDNGLYPFYVRSPKVEKINTYSYDGEAILMAGDGVGAGKVFHYVNGKFDYHQRVYNLHNIKDVMGKFLFYFIRDQFHFTMEENNAKSTVDSVRLPWLKAFPIPIPSRKEQQAIVSYLDAKVAKIDSYITTATKKIAALDELKQVTIANAVTKGINPNAPMKNSGIPWIGMVPEHWEIKNLRAYIQIYSEKNHAKKQLLSVTREQGVITRNVESKEENHNFIPDDLSGYKLVCKGDFAINKMKSWQGSYGVSDYEGIVSPAYYVCKLCFENKDFFSKAIRSKVYVPFFNQYSKGIRVDQWDLSPIALKNIPFFEPPLSEQTAIVTYIDRKVAQIEQMRAAELSQIEKLKEYKQRLISDVVTGKVKVTND